MLWGINIFCGHPGEEEGNISSVWCLKCEIEKNQERHEVVRMGFKRKKDILHERMTSSSALKFEPAHIGDTDSIPIERPDEMNLPQFCFA